MPLREAISFLRGAVDHGASSRGPAVYAFHDGWAYARGPSILAAYPIPMMTGTFGIAADDLGVERKSRWRLGALKRVVAVADAWDPRPDAPSAFRGPGLRGVVSPLREGGR